MTKYSLRARMMILILAPTLLIGLLLTTFFVVHRYNELQAQLIDSGSSIIEPLAVASEYGMTFRSREALQQLIGLLHRRHSDIVRSITVFDSQNNLFVTSNYNYSYSYLQLPKGVAIPSELMLTRKGDALILRTPILADNQFSSSEFNIEQDRNLLGYIAIELDLRTVRLQQYKEVFVAILLLIICLCIAMLFAYRLMRDVTGPIRNMVNTVDRIRQGQLDSRVEGYMLGELDILKNGINSMAVSIADYHEEMQQNIDQATSDLRETLEQMEIQNVELDLAKKRAQEAARIKSEFLANMSHELRTPLNGVIGFTRQTLKTQLTATQSDYLQTIERSANNLLSIINDVLDFSKLEAGKLQLEYIPFSLRETIDEIAILLAHSAHEKGLELTVDVRNDVPEYVIGDPLRLQQVITNLLGNAIKFTEHGNIDVRVELRTHYGQEAELEIQVHDTGIGISERQQSELFQAFRQADASISRRHGGTGLGLVITQRLVKEMGGDINFHSQPNKGSTFWFHIRIGLSSSIPSNIYSQEELEGKNLAYVELNPSAAQATLEILDTTPLNVTYSPTLSQMPKQHYDIILLGAPINIQQDIAFYRERISTAKSLADRVIIALPTQALIDIKMLQRLGINATLNKPMSQGRLINTLTEKTNILSITHEATNPLPRLPLTVMAVDDNPANLKLLGALLNELVEKTILCNNAEEALIVARVESIDIVLMDIQMPNIDGIRAAELIHQIPQHAHIPIIAVTANAAVGERERLINAGMDDYLTKPIDEKVLTRMLNHFKKAPVVSPPEIVKNCSLDWNLALQQSSNKVDLACDLLIMLLDFLPEVAERVQHVLDGAQDDSIVDIIHKLHGSCSYSGVPRLKDACNYIEQQLRNGATAEELEPEWLELLDEIENVQREGTKKLGEM